VKLRILLLVMVPILAAGMIALAWPKGDDQAGAKLAELPAAVQEALRRLTPAAAVLEIETITHDGITVYEVEFKKGDRKSSVTLAAQGQVIESEESVEDSELPAAVRDSIRKKFPKAEIVESDSVTVHSFEVTISVDGKKRELELLASGQMEEDDEDEDHDHDGDGEDDGDDDDGDDEDDD
jgi:hypothetical protein